MHISILFAGFLSSVFFIFLFSKISHRNNFLVSRLGVPLTGGIGLGCAFFITGVVALEVLRRLSLQSAGVFAASFIMLIFGAIDDRWELSVQAKFLVQLIATALLVYSGTRTRIVFLGDALNVLVTFLWVIGITNALNHLDVIDGLAGGISLLVSHAFFVIAVLNNDIETAVFALTVAACSFGFLVFNLPPAHVYMGNAGSHFLGFLLAAIAVMLSYAPAQRVVALFSPLLILGFPIFDTAFLILMRIKKERSIFRKSNDHLALRFLKKGYSKNHALLSMLGLSFLFSSSGIALSRVSDAAGLVIIAAVGLVSLLVARDMGKVEVLD